MTATPEKITPEYVTEVAKQVEKDLPAEPKQNSPTLPRISGQGGGHIWDNVALGPSLITTVQLLDQYGHVVAQAPIASPIAPNGSSATITLPPITIACV